MYQPTRWVTTDFKDATGRKLHCTVEDYLDYKTKQRTVTHFAKLMQVLSWQPLGDSHTSCQPPHLLARQKCYLCTSIKGKKKSYFLRHFLPETQLLMWRAKWAYVKLKCHNRRCTNMCTFHAYEWPTFNRTTIHDTTAESKAAVPLLFSFSKIFWWCDYHQWYGLDLTGNNTVRIVKWCSLTRVTNQSLADPQGAGPCGLNSMSPPFLRRHASWQYWACSGTLLQCPPSQSVYALMSPASLEATLGLLLYRMHMFLHYVHNALCNVCIS